MSRLSTSLALALLVLAPSAPAARAQEGEDYAGLNRRAIEALQAGEHDEGAAILMRIFELPGYEKDAGTAYNLACAHALKADVEKGFEWLGKAVDWGWGSGSGTLVGAATQQSHVEMTRSDPDLENLRKDPRFEALIERMTKAAEMREAKRKKGEEYAKVPAFHVPDAVGGLAEMPVLVVIHDAGSTKDAVVAGRWRRIADELGFALIAPSGTVLAAEEPEQGMTWFDDAGEYTRRYWTFEKPVQDAVSAFRKEHPIDKSRVVIAGEGPVGGLVALNVAIGSPGLYKGAVALNGGLSAELMAQKAPTAGKMGLCVRILSDEAVARKLMAEAGREEAEADKLVKSWSQSLQTWGIAGEVTSFAKDASDPEQERKLLVLAVKAVLPEKAPADAGAPK